MHVGSEWVSHAPQCFFSGAACSQEGRPPGCDPPVQHPVTHISRLMMYRRTPDTEESLMIDIDQFVRLIASKRVSHTPQCPLSLPASSQERASDCEGHILS